MIRLLLPSILLESALNRALDPDPDSRARLRALQGTVVGLDVHGLGELFLHPGVPLRLRTAPERAPTLWLRASPPVWLRLATGEATLQALTVQGDGELLSALQAALADLRIDWEEQLAGWLGDIPAHILANRLRAGVTWGKHITDTLAADLREYLQEESRQLAGKAVIRDFRDGVDTLVVDTDRLEARLRRLEQAAR